MTKKVKLTNGGTKVMSPRRFKLQNTVEPERKILVAVDFGTTFSGLAWVQTRKPEIQTPIIQWPDATSGGLEGITSDKVPTEIQYEGQNYKWGFQIGDFGQRHQWFKLGLDPTQRRDTSELARLFPDPIASPPGYDTPPEKLVRDYLTSLRQHAEQILRYKLPESAMQSTPIEFIITVPAVWTDAAQAKTRICAEQAGMGAGSALHIISEPEAAAMYALDAMDPHNIQVGDTFVLCDAGGGTVDLISYTVSALKPLLEITEASPGSGSLCGSSFLNRIFQKYLEDHLGSNRHWDKDVLEDAMQRFEHVIKRQFRGNAGEEFMVPVPGIPDSPGKRVRRGRLCVPGTEVKKVFEPVVREVIALIEGQIEATQKSIKAVLLVGGFGQSAYLRDRIRQEIGSKLEIMQSPNGWTAVVRGALMKGLASTSPDFATVKISGRSARKHYGLSSHKSFVDGVHDVSQRYWDGFFGEYRIVTMDWFIKKGDVVEEQKPLKLEYTRQILRSKGPPSIFNDHIFVFSDPANAGPPMYPTTPGVMRLATVSSDLSRVPKHLYPQIIGDNREVYYDVQYHFEVTYYSAYTKYELVHNGLNYGQVTAEYV